MPKSSWMMLAACVLLGACADGTLSDAPPREQRTSGEGPRQIRSLFTTPMHDSGFEERLREHAATEARLDQLWARAWRMHNPPPGRPAVDLERDAVVFVAMGGQASGGYTIRVDSAVVSAGALDVYVTERSPGRGCVVTMATTAPAEAVAVSGAAGLSVRFHERAVVHNCD